MVEKTLDFPISPTTRGICITRFAGSTPSAAENRPVSPRLSSARGAALVLGSGDRELGAPGAGVGVGGPGGPVQGAGSGGVPGSGNWRERLVWTL